MDNFWWSTLWLRWRADLPKSKGRACRGWSQQQSSRRTEPYEYLVLISWNTDTSQQDGQFYPCFMNVIFTSGVMRSSRMTVSNNFVNSFIHDIRPPRKWVACLHIYGATKIYITRSLGALRAPTSSWRPFGPAWLRPSRPSGAQAVWPTQWCIR